MKNCSITEKNVSLKLFNSFVIALYAEIQGGYKRQKTMYEYADNGVNADFTAVFKSKDGLEYKTEIEETTPSFATRPDKSDTTDFHSPNPSGEKSGAIDAPIFPKAL